MVGAVLVLPSPARPGLAAFTSLCIKNNLEVTPGEITDL